MRSKVVGGKYWYQYRGPGDGVGFHYDKDEGMASDQMIMRPPPLVGVTHLEDWGAPTLMLNQSTIMNGNVDAPTVPTSGWLVYPRRNKHALHRGDIDGFNQIVAANEAAFAAQPALSAERDFIKEKAALLCLTELLFQRPSHERTVPFADIARATRMDVSQVEWMMMRAMSLKLLKGKDPEADHD